MKRLIIYIAAILIFASTENAYCEVIRLATMNWQPFYGKNLSEGGFFTALSREAFKRSGYELKVVFIPWKRALERSKEGNFDGLLGAYYSDERENHYYFTDPIASNDEVFITRKGHDITYNNLDDLKNIRIGGLRGGAQSTELIKQGFRIELASDDILNIKKLNFKRFDLIIIGKQSFYYLLSSLEELKPFSGNFDVLEPPYKTYDLFVTITKKRINGKDIVNKFNKALQDMKSDGSYVEIIKRFGQNVQILYTKSQ